MYERVQQVRLSIIRTGVLRRPLIVDERTGVIIDGTHRYEALKGIGIRRIPVVGVDYLSESEVRVGGWVRIYALKQGLSVDDPSIKDLLTEIQGDYMRRVGMSLVISMGAGDQRKIYEKIASLEKSSGFMHNVDRIMFSERINFSALRRIPSIAVVPPPLDKKDVIEAGVGGKPFPPKSTRHITVLKKLEMRTRIRELRDGR